MWLQLIYFMLPSALVGIPVGAYSVRKFIGTRGTKEISSGSSALAEAQPRSAVGALASIERQLQEQESLGDSRFRSSLTVLEERIHENSSRNIYGYLLGLLEELQALDAKLRISGAVQQARLTYAKYAPLISKITDISASNYYGDFVRNPDHWDDPKRNRLQVELAVLALAKEVSGDIRLLNSSQELNFQVSVESIIGKAASAAQATDPDTAIERLFDENSKISMDELTGDIESLTAAVEVEAAALASKQLAESEADKLNAEARELEAKKFRGGSKSGLELQGEEQKSIRPELISREVHRHTFTIYGPGGDSKSHLVSQINSVTGESIWKEFPSVYGAADWVDEAIAEEEKKHSFKCDCVYCRPE